MPGRPVVANLARSDQLEVSTATSYKLVACNRGLVIIPKLDSQLVEVDLSYNNIVRITGVANLPSLQRLVLTSNQITELQGLNGLPSLQHLLLQGNLMCTLQDLNLSMLAELPQLQTLYLQNSDRSQPNPVCSRPEYKEKVLSSLTALRNLDGQRRPCCTGATTLHGPKGSTYK